ncbi:MAG: glutathione synthase/RimK-type ligase-like ATP-grasp enzyme [Flavobacteriaceae bacterium]|jgi:glutathione synthase/RimK-type ligase-like ATP-grasp enzyme
MKQYDITILTDGRYLESSYEDESSQNVIDEDYMLFHALERKGLKVHRTNWDDANFDWTTTEHIIFRTIWDYAERYPEFASWLELVCAKTKLINEKSLIYWNIDKHYLADLSKAGVRIPNTEFIEIGDKRTLSEIVSELNWKEIILKPSISGGSRHTYRFELDQTPKYEAVFKELISEESMLVQEFQSQILTKGEVACMVYGGEYSHAIIKRGKPGEFRIQDDFGGTVAPYKPDAEMIAFVEKAFAACSPKPVYARIDIIWNNQNELCIGEIELIEPELWFRLHEPSADQCAAAVHEHLTR